MKVVVTGAAGGIGSEIVRGLSKRKDIQIVAISRSADALDSLVRKCHGEFGNEIEPIVSDFSEAGFASKLVARIGQSHDGIDCLINNAGHLVNRSFEETSEKELYDQFNLNLFAPFLLIKEMMSLLKNSKRAHVVNIGSMGGYMGSEKFPGLAAYSASKGALAILSECLAKEFLDTGISVNCLALGSANTSMLRKAFPSYESPTSPEGVAQFIVEFAMTGHLYFNGRVLPVAGLST